MPFSGKLFKTTLNSSSSESQAALVAIGSLADAHEAVLAALEDPASVKANPFIPSREFYDEVRASGGRLPLFPLPKPDYNVHLIRALAGTWKACRLLNPHSGGRMCGVVLWHSDVLPDSRTDASDEDSIASSSELEFLAAYIRRNICQEGAAGQYNLSEEPETFLKLGGRIVDRSAWDASGVEGARNKNLDPDDDRKLRTAAIEERVANGSPGPDFAFFPVDSYFQSTWESLKKCGYGMVQDEQDEGTGDDDDDESRDAVESTTSTIGEDGVDTTALGNTNGPILRAHGEGFYALFRHQEYLSARVMLSTDHGQDKDGKGSIVKCIVLYTYECPEELGDAFLEGGMPISGEASTILVKGDFWSHASQENTTVENLRRHMALLSSAKLLDLLEKLVAREQKTDVVALRKILAAIYEPTKDHISSPKVYAPSLKRLHENVFAHCADEPAVAETIISSLHDFGCLVEMVRQVNESRDRGHVDVAKSGKLLEKVASVEVAKLLLDAGAEVDSEIIEDRQFFWKNKSEKDDVLALLQEYVDKSDQSPAAKKAKLSED